MVKKNQDTFVNTSIKEIYFFLKKKKVYRQVAHNFEKWVSLNLPPTIKAGLHKTYQNIHVFHGKSKIQGTRKKSSYTIKEKGKEGANITGNK